MQKQSLDEADFEPLFREHYPAMVLFAQKFVTDLDTARDIAQQVFVNIFEKKDSIEISGSIKAYLLRAVKNTAFNFLRQKQTKERHGENIKASSPDHVDESKQLELAELSNEIFRIIEDLPPKCKQIFKLNRFEGKKNKEIAAELDISIRTVETQISKALKFLRANLPKELLVLGLLFLNNS